MENLMRSEIKWVRLQEACQVVVQAEIGDDVTMFLHGSIDLPLDLRAAVERKKDRVDIMLNLVYNKTIKDIIESLAHELTHIVMGAGDEAHVQTKFTKTMTRIQRALVHEYDEESEGER